MAEEKRIRARVDYTNRVGCDTPNPDGELLYVVTEPLEKLDNQRASAPQSWFSKKDKEILRVNNSIADGLVIVEFYPRPIDESRKNSGKEIHPYDCDKPKIILASRGKMRMTLFITKLRQRIRSRRLNQKSRTYRIVWKSTL